MYWSIGMCDMEPLKYCLVLSVFIQNLRYMNWYVKAWNLFLTDGTLDHILADFNCCRCTELTIVLVLSVLLFSYYQLAVYPIGQKFLLTEGCYRICCILKFFMRGQVLTFHILKRFCTCSFHGTHCEGCQMSHKGQYEKFAISMFIVCDKIP